MNSGTDKIILKIREKTSSPGPRKRSEGDSSGEWYREDILRPAITEAIKQHKQIIVDLDGTSGYATSWLEEVFGGSAREFGGKNILKIIEFISTEEDYLIDDIKEYIDDVIVFENQNDE